MAKTIASLLLIALMFVIGYFNMTITWGVTLKSWTAFFLFMFANMGVMTLLEVVKRSKD